MKLGLSATILWTMIDKFLSRMGQKADKVIDPFYKPEAAVTGKDFVNPHKTRLIVIFPPWHDGGWFYKYLIKRLSRKGWAVLAYHFSPQILEAEDKTVINSFIYIQQRVTADLEKLAGKNYSEIKLLSFSLGGVSLAMVADKFAKFTSATAVVGGDDLAVDAWHGIRSTNIRKEFEHEHIGIRRLANDWHKIAPKNHVKNFKGKKVKLVISVNDKIILTKYQLALAQALEEAGALVSIKKSRVGHIATTVLFLLFGRID
jgi:hypothetical protein